MLVVAFLDILKSKRRKTILCLSILTSVQVCVGTLGWWVFGWAFAYGSQGTPANGFIGTDGFFGIGFYTVDATTGVISPLASCDADGCQSTMLSWFFQRLGSGLASLLKLSARGNVSCIPVEIN